MEPSAPEAKDLFRVQLDAFEGPLDLLLALIQKNEMDIFNVRLAKITEDYLTYIGLAQHYDLDLAGDYLVVAATLLLMKSRALIPREETEEDIEEDDPELLAQRLEEYKQFKAVADALRERELLSRDRHFRQTEAYKQLGDSLDFYDLNIYDLYTAFKTILAEIGDSLPGVIQDEDWTVDEKMVELQELLESSGRIKLTDYLRGMKAKSTGSRQNSGPRSPVGEGAYEKLKVSEEKYRQLFELESDAVWLVDNETEHIVEANAAAVALYGYTREEMLAMNATDLSAEPEKTRQAMKGRCSRIIVRKHRKKDGTSFRLKFPLATS